MKVYRVEDVVPLNIAESETIYVEADGFMIEGDYAIFVVETGEGMIERVDAFHLPSRIIKVEEDEQKEDS